MLALHLTFFALSGSCLAFSIIELGLSAYVATIWGGSRQVPYWDPYNGYQYRSVHVDTPGIVDFLLFSACWSVLASIAALVLPWFYTRKGFVHPMLNTILGVSLAVVYFVTSVFWLACFADIASLLGGGISSSDYLNAVIAFAVLLWLLFLALFILAVLALCGVLVSDWVGYQSMRKTHTDTAPPQETREAGPPVHDAPMSTAPTAPSELSTRDAEALQNQPISRAQSTSSPSAILSAELSGDSIIHDHHAGHT